jgi:hypothetical protein
MKIIIRHSLIITLMSLSLTLPAVHAMDPIVPSKLNSNEGEKTNPIVSNQDPTSCTPCPFINTLIRGGEIGAEETTVEALVTAALKYGINKNLMEFLAKARTEHGSTKILMSKLLDPSIAPAHLGSLARKDGDLSVVETDRLEQLKSDPQFNTDERISHKQLQAYQEYCWHMSDMSFKDRAFSTAEVELLWGLFGGYRTENSDGKDTIPLNLVYDFLKDNSLPENFVINTEDPVTIGRLAFSLIWNSCRR